MKNTTALLVALGLTLPAMTFAQDDGQRPARRHNTAGQADRGPGNNDARPNGERRPPSPIIDALDVNHDGVIDEDEIKNAPEALRKLDKNGDGKLTMDELRPPRPDGAGGPPPGGEGVGPRGNRDGGAGDGARPQRRNAGPPQGQ